MKLKYGGHIKVEADSDEERARATLKMKRGEISGVYDSGHFVSSNVELDLATGSTEIKMGDRYLFNSGGDTARSASNSIDSQGVMEDVEGIPIRYDRLVRVMMNRSSMDYAQAEDQGAMTALGVFLAEQIIEDQLQSKNGTALVGRDRKIVKKVQESLSDYTYDMDHLDEESIEDICEEQKKRPVIICAGSRTHSIGLTLYRGSLLVSNRMHPNTSKEGHQATNLYKYDPENEFVIEEILQLAKELRESADTDSVIMEYEADLVESVRDRLEEEDQGDFWKASEEDAQIFELKMKEQVGGTCWWHSTKGSVMGAIMLLKDEAQVKKNPRMSVEERREGARGLYKKVLSGKITTQWAMKKHIAEQRALNPKYKPENDPRLRASKTEVDEGLEGVD